MNAKKLLLTTVSGFIVMFLLSWLGHVVIISGMFETSSMSPIERESPLMYGLVAAYLILAFLMAYLYPKVIRGESIFGNGIWFGILIGLLFSAPVSLILYSMITTPFSRVIVEVIWHMIEQGAGGIVIAYVYGLKAAAPAAESI